MPSPFTIRPARLEHDVAALQEIERRAGMLFVEVGMPEIAADDPPSFDDLRSAAAIYVAEDTTGRVVGYAQLVLVDGHTHLEQLSVDPASGRQGIGGALLAAVADFARDRGDDQVTLTTFRDVAFNAPYYRRHGYEAVADGARSAALTDLMAREAGHGLDPTQRVAMRLLLGSEPGANR